MMDFRGIHTALITPFRDGEIDYTAVTKMLDLQVAAKVTSVVISGSTGEGYMLSNEEKLKLFEFCKNHIAGRIKVIASVGTNNTAESIALSKEAEELGIDALMVVAPYYNKPPQEGVYQHFMKIHDATNLPILAYNVPGRSIINITDETLARLSTLERVVALKDATGNLSRPFTLRNINHADLVMLSGDDITSLAFYAAGGQGVVSVASNIYPEKFVNIYNAWFSGNVVSAQKMHDELIPLLVALNLDTNPICIKYAASLLDLCLEDVRLPLVALPDEKKLKIKQEIDKLK